MQIFSTKNFVFKQKWYFLIPRRRCFCSAGAFFLEMWWGSAARGEIVVAGRGNLNNCTFSGWVWVAFDPRETRERPAKKQGEVAEGKNLNNRTVLGVGKVVMGAEAK